VHGVCVVSVKKLLSHSSNIIITHRAVYYVCMKDADAAELFESVNKSHCNVTFTKHVKFQSNNWMPVAGEVYVRVARANSSL